MEQGQALIGIFFFLTLAYFLSNSKKHIDKRLVINAFILQLVLALLMLGLPAFNIPGPLFFLFSVANDFFINVVNFTNKGSEFLFGPLMDTEKSGFILALHILPTIIFFSSLSSILYYFKILPFIIAQLSKLIRYFIKSSGAETLSVVANIFLGQTEAPLAIKPFIPKMTSSELFTVMVGGMATIAGGVLAAYVGLLSSSIPDIAGHLIVASVLSAPAALMFSKIIIPETGTPETLGSVPKQNYLSYENAIDAAASGASEGLKLAANVGAMLLAFVALIYMMDAMFIQIGEWINFGSWGQSLDPFLQDGETTQLSLTLILSWLFVPFAFFLGIPLDECFLAASLLGKKTVFNEFIAYLDLSQLSEQFTPRTRIILSYALCGFANFSSIAIQIGGIGGMAESRKKEIARLGIKSVIAGTFAAFTTACIAAILY